GRRRGRVHGGRGERGEGGRAAPEMGADGARGGGLPRLHRQPVDRGPAPDPALRAVRGPGRLRLPRRSAGVQGDCPRPDRAPAGRAPAPHLRGRRL
ncbi:MAG: hypothetical protein AVDCRST_MAG59-5304, partial [uncultured Thermomicrobiales bacterium]